MKINRKLIYSQLLLIIQKYKFTEHTPCSISANDGRFCFVASKGHASFPYKSFTVRDTGVEEDLICYLNDGFATNLVEGAYNNSVLKKEKSLKEFCQFLTDTIEIEKTTKEKE